MLTFKQPVRESRAKVVEETEIVVSDFEATRKIMAALGYHESLRLRKTRIEYTLKTAKIVLDKYHDAWEHIPWFMEIETQSLAEMDEVLGILGFDRTETKPWSIKELMAHYKKPL